MVKLLLHFQLMNIDNLLKNLCTSSASVEGNYLWHLFQNVLKLIGKSWELCIFATSGIKHVEIRHEFWDLWKNWKYVTIFMFFLARAFLPLAANWQNVTFFFDYVLRRALL